MYRFVVTFLLLLVVNSPIFAQVIIEEENRVPNREPGFCTWACLETLGRHHKIKQLYNLVDKREKEFTWEWNGSEWVKSPYVWVDYGNYRVKEHRSPGSHRALINKLNSLNVRYRYQNYHNYNKSLIKEAVKNKQGCMVVVRSWEEGAEFYDAHATLILDYNEDGVNFYDPNDMDNVYFVTHQWFNYYWLGYTLVLE